MNKKENRMAVRQTVEKAVIRDEQNRRMKNRFSMTLQKECEHYDKSKAPCER